MRKKDVSMILMIVIGVIILVLAIILGAIFLIGHQSNESEESVNLLESLEKPIEEVVVETPIPEKIEETSLEEIEEAETPEPKETETPSPKATESPSPSKEPEATPEKVKEQEDPQGGTASGTVEGSGAAVEITESNVNEIAGTVMGVDVSKYQGTIDWQKVKAAGIQFAMVRVGYRAKTTGEIFEDPNAKYNMQEAQAAGIKVGAYFFSSAITEEEARAEADFVTGMISKYKITYPVAFNCEDYASKNSRQNTLTISERTKLACAFLDRIAAAGYTPMFYAAKGELENNRDWDKDTLSSKYKIWVAHYPKDPYPTTEKSSYSGTHAMWQFTSQGTVDGIAKKTDINIAYFDYSGVADAKNEEGAERVEADPEALINFAEVNENVTAKQEANLRSEPTTLKDNVVGTLKHGEVAQRTGIGHNGWSRIIYNGTKYYAVSSVLTTDMNDVGKQAPVQGPVYTPTGDTVTAKDVTNLRSVPGTESSDTIVGQLHHGETLTRIATGDNGWSQLDYNGQAVYAISSYLMTP